MRLSRVTSFARRLESTHSANRLSLAASGASFWLVLAAFPAGIAAVNIFGLVTDQQTVANRLAQLTESLPGSIGLGTQLQRVAAPSPGTLGLDTLLVVLSIWSVSSAVNHLLSAFRASYGLAQRGFPARRLYALAVALGAVILIGLCGFVIAMVSEGGPLLTCAVVFALTVVTLMGLSYAALGSFMPFTASAIGSMVSALVLILVSLGYGFYVQFAANLDAFYGALSGIVVTMFAVFVVVYAVLFGAAANALFFAPEVPLKVGMVENSEFGTVSP